MSHKPFSGCSGTFQGNGNPLQYSCLENPMDGGAWWAAVYGVAQSRTRLKRLSCSSRHIPLFHQEADFPESSAYPKNQKWASKKSAATLWTFPVATTDHQCLSAPVIYRGWATVHDSYPQEFCPVAGTA